jgi:predicted O-linked N-acetylglucosamine transferase (SPINDLY family)
VLLRLLRSLRGAGGNIDFPAAFALFQRGALDEAERACEVLVAAAPTRAAALYLQGLIAEQRGQNARAEERFGRAVAEDPEPTYRLALAAALKARGAGEAAAPHYELAWESLPAGDPRRFQAALEAAWLHADARPQQAETWYRRASAERPADLAALDGLAEVLHAQCREPEAVEVAQRRLAIRHDTGRAIRRALMAIPSLCDSEQQIEDVRARLDADLDRLAEARLAPMSDPVRELGLVPFYLAYQGRNDRDLMMKLARVCRASYPTQRECARRLALGRRLRVGFVSTFFHSHSVGRTTLGLIRDLPRDAAETWVFAVAPQSDALAERIRLTADHYVRLADALNLDAARAAIDAAGLDVLVFADVGMHPLTYFLAFWRLAPVQVNSWGHPVTSGIDTLDYYLSSRDLETVDGDAHYSEALLRGDSFYLAGYERPGRPAHLKTRSELGLPEGTLYLCPQNLFKLTPDFDAALGGILERDPYGQIVLFEAKQPQLTAKLRRRLARRLGDLAKRVGFLPRRTHAEFLQVIANADAVLDPFHFSGANTNAEALAMGVPLVTLPSGFMRGRLAYALCSQIGMHELIAADSEDYVERAVGLGRDADRREHACNRLAERSAQLFERRDAGQALGDSLQRIVQRG